MIWRPRWGMLLTAVVGGIQTAMSLVQLDTWRGVWSSTFVASSLGLVVTVPVLAACVATLSHVVIRGGADTLSITASRPRWHMDLRAVLEGWIWANLGLAVGLVPSSLVTALGASADRPDLLILLPMSAWCLGAISLAWWCGPRMPLVVSGPAVGVGLYLVYGVTVFAAPGVPDGLTPTGSLPNPMIETKDWFLLLQAAWWLTLAGALIVAAQRSWRVLMPMVAAAGLVGVVLVDHVPDRSTPRAEQTALQCTSSGRIDVCLTRPFRHLAADLIVPLTDVADLLSPGMTGSRIVLVDTSAETGRRDDLASREIQRVVAGRPATTVLRTADVTGLPGTVVINDDEVRRFAVEAVFLPTAAPMLYPVGVQPGYLLVRWALEAMNLSTDGLLLTPQEIEYSPAATAAYRWLRDISSRERQVWFKEHRDAIRSGELTFADFA